MEEIEEKAEELLSGVEIEIDSLDKDFDIDEDIESLMDRIQKADRSYRLALDDPDIYLKLSFLCFSSGLLDQAEDWVKKSLRLKNTFTGFFVKGRILYEKKDYKGAIGEYDEALKYDDRPTIHEYKYRALKNRDMPERALSSLERVLEVDESPELVAEKADLLVEVGDLEGAKKFYNKAEERDPDLSNREEKVEQLLKEAENKLIPEKYDEILELDNENVEAWLGKAECYWKLKEGKKAKEVMNKALEQIESDKISDRLEEYKKETELASKCEVCGGDGNCQNCGGSGDCELCGGTGNCPDCQGTAECGDCSGTGECPNCDGTGKTGWFSKCEVCSGTGLCQTCEGFGDCPTCEGTGNCPRCGGNKNCQECQGSGICSVCEGKGIKVD